MERRIVNILRIIIVTLVVFTGRNAYAQGQSMENPVTIATSPEKFIFLHTLNPCDWGFLQFASSGKDMYYRLTLEKPMNIMVLSLGSDKIIAVKRISGISQK